MPDYMSNITQLVQTRGASINDILREGSYMLLCAFGSLVSAFIVGYFTSFNGVSVNRVARLNVDGSLDASFNIGGGFNQFVKRIKIQSDGKIICAGNFTSFNSIAKNYIARLHPDGRLFDQLQVRPQ
jgi:hypothetical protein